MAILVDVMINTGATLILAACTLHEKGAVHAIIPHGMSHSIIHLTITCLFTTPRVSSGGQYEHDRRTIYHRVGGMYFHLYGFLTP